MAKYKVISLSVGIGNKIYKSGDVLQSKNFPENINPDQLVKAGFLKVEKMTAAEKKAAEKEEKKAEETVVPEDESENDEETVDSLIDELGGLDPVFIKEDGTEVFSIDDATKQQISKELENRGIDHNFNDSKTVLFDLL